MATKNQMTEKYELLNERRIDSIETKNHQQLIVAHRLRPKINNNVIKYVNIPSDKPITYIHSTKMEFAQILRTNYVPIELLQ